MLSDSCRDADRMLRLETCRSLFSLLPSASCFLNKYGCIRICCGWQGCSLGGRRLQERLGAWVIALCVMSCPSLDTWGLICKGTLSWAAFVPSAPVSLLRMEGFSSVWMKSACCALAHHPSALKWKPQGSWKKKGHFSSQLWGRPPRIPGHWG